MLASSSKHQVFLSSFGLGWTCIKGSVLIMALSGPLDDCGSTSRNPGTLGKAMCSLLRAVLQASIALPSLLSASSWPPCTPQMAVATSLMLFLASFHPVQPFLFIWFVDLLLINSSSPPLSQSSPPPACFPLLSPLFFLLWFWGPNSGSHAFKACTLPTMLALQSGKYFYFLSCFILNQEGGERREGEGVAVEGRMEEVRYGSV